MTTNPNVADMRGGATSSAYDEILYPTHAYVETHPDNIASIATLFGMTPPAIETCRVLEVGCSNGGNLIPMAVSLPDSDLIGIDLAPRPIQNAIDIIGSATIKNIRVQVMDLMEVTRDFGAFDYIIAHGFYTWVPAPVQEKLLAVCRENLTPNGVAFVSYNTYPAGHFRTASREMMLFHLDRMRQGTDRVHEGKNFLRLMANSAEGNDIWKSVLESESQRLDQRDNHAIHHDELNPNFSAVYFTDFVRSAARHGLQFVSEARIRDAISPRVKTDTLEAIDKLAGSDLTARQQYLDFVTFNGFRRSLLCHKEIQLQHVGVADRLMRLWVASPMNRLTTSADGTTEFKNRHGPGTIKTKSAPLIAALQILEDIWPHGETFQDLERRISPPAHGGETRIALTESMLKLAVNGLLQLRAHPIRIARQVSDRPVASYLSRLQAKNGSLLTTLFHTHVNIEDQRTRRLLELLDGSRDLSALTRNLATDFPSLSGVRAHVNTALENFYQMGLLIA